MSFSTHLITRWLMDKTFVCPDIDCYVVSLRPLKLGNGMTNYRGPSSMSRYGHSNWFANFLFFFALPLARKYILPAAVNFASSQLHACGSGKVFKKKYFQKFQVRCAIPRLVINITAKRKRLKKVKKHLLAHRIQLCGSISTTKRILSFSHLISKSFQCRKC